MASNATFVFSSVLYRLRFPAISFLLLGFSRYSYFILSTCPVFWDHYRPVYTSKDCFETFPLAKTSTELESKGEQYHLYRQSTMQSRQEGLTDIYNRFHDQQETAED